MLTLRSDTDTLPAQFVFDHGQLGGPAGLLAFVVSGAQPWIELHGTVLASGLAGANKTDIVVVENRPRAR